MAPPELLSAYVTSGSEAAFSALVEQYVALVYSAALRQTRDPHTADDVAQTVFLALAQNAAKIRPDTVLPSWLLTATRYVCSDYRKADARRKQREQQCAEMAAARAREADCSQWKEVSETLDEAVAQLPECNRSALILRYFQVLSMREVGAALGLSPTK